MAKFDSAIPYIQKAEGGLSRATTDTASLHPSPWTYQGKTGWHTNRGITYQTFVGMAPKVGYDISPENFFTMPDRIWLGIYKIGFWDPMPSDSLTSQAMANAVVDFAWASGVGGATNQIKKWLYNTYKINASSMSDIARAINGLTAQNEKVVFESFINHRKNFFLSLNQPANEKGWLARMDTLLNQGLQLVKDNPGTAVSGGFFLPSS